MAKLVPRPSDVDFVDTSMDAIESQIGADTNLPIVDKDPAVKLPDLTESEVRELLISEAVTVPMKNIVVYLQQNMPSMPIASHIAAAQMLSQSMLGALSAIMQEHKGVMSSQRAAMALLLTHVLANVEKALPLEFDNIASFFDRVKAANLLEKVADACPELKTLSEHHFSMTMIRAVRYQMALHILGVLGAQTVQVQEGPVPEMKPYLNPLLAQCLDVLKASVTHPSTESNNNPLTTIQTDGQLSWSDTVINFFTECCDAQDFCIAHDGRGHRQREQILHESLHKATHESLKQIMQKEGITSVEVDAIIYVCVAWFVELF